MFSHFQFSIQQMSLKRLNVFVHHHENINFKAETLANHILEESKYQNDLLWHRLDNQVNELGYEKEFVEKLEMDVDKQKSKFNQMNQFLEEVIHELNGQQVLNHKLRQQHAAQQEQHNFPMQDIRFDHMGTSN